MTLSDTGRNARGFDRLAPLYDLGTDVLLLGRVHRIQVCLLSRLPPVERVLVVGGGSGRLLAALLAQRRPRSVLSLDISSGMTRRAVHRVGHDPQVEFRIGGLEALCPDERFDLVVTACFLDLFEGDPLAAVMARLTTALRPGGSWLFSDFAVAGPGPLPPLLRRALVAGLYRFFRLACGIQGRRLADFEAEFARRGFITAAEATMAGGLLRALLYRAP